MALKLVYFVLEKELLNLSEMVPVFLYLKRTVGISLLCSFCSNKFYNWIFETEKGLLCVRNLFKYCLYLINFEATSERKF